MELHVFALFKATIRWPILMTIKVLLPATIAALTVYFGDVRHTSLVDILTIAEHAQPTRAVRCTCVEKLERKDTNSDSRKRKGSSLKKASINTQVCAWKHNAKFTFAAPTWLPCSKNMRQYLRPVDIASKAQYIRYITLVGTG